MLLKYSYYVCCLGTLTKLLEHFILDRIPVPKYGECNSSLGKDNPSCSICEKYYNPNIGYGNNDDGACVYVPSKATCFAAKYARENELTIDMCGMDKICHAEINSQKFSYILIISNIK